MRQQIKHRISILVGLALIGLSVNGYAAEVSADKTPTTAASSESNGASEMHLMRLIWCPALRLFPMVHPVLNMGLWIAV